MSSSPNAEAVPARPRLEEDGAREVAARARILAGDRVVQALTAITLLGGLLRFATLDARGYWVDEAVTVMRVDQGFWTMLSGLVNEESSPPLYFVLAWLWAHLAGTGEVGLRSLTALAGTATIPVVYGIGATLCSRRVGLAAALLSSVSPLLVWHAQDARPYALLVLFAALSIFFFVRSLAAPSGWLLTGWAAASSLALLTSYLTAFLVVVEAVWLVRRLRLGRNVLLAIAGAGVVGVALAPFALEQQQNDAASWIGRQSLAVRLVSVPAQFLVGYQPPLQRTSVVVFALLALAALWLLVTQADPAEQRGAWTAAILGLVSLAGPLLLALGGLDGLLTRTVTAAWVPLVVVVAAGAAARGVGRAGTILLATMSVLSLGTVVATANDPKFEREDWRGAAQALGPSADRAIVLSPGKGQLPFRYYRQSERVEAPTNRRVREIVLIGLGPQFRTIGERPRPPRPEHVDPPAPGFNEVERIDAETYTLIRFRAAEPVFVDPSLAESGFDSAAAVLIEEQSP